MVKDIGEVLPTPEQLEGEQVDKESIKDKVLIVKDFALLTSSYEGQDNFAVVQTELNGKLVTFTGGQVITKKLQSIGKEGLPVRCRLGYVKAKKGGRHYWDLISASDK